MLTVVVNNSNRKEEIDFKEKVRKTMIKQIQKKLLNIKKPNHAKEFSTPH